jgi:DHA1 family bicyclomycin/chloramphenicol resistance-like MFS transporter
VVLSALCAVSPNVAVLIGLRLLQGLAGSAGLVISRAMVRDLYGGGREAARIFSLLMLVSGVAPIAAPLLGAQILRLTSWRGIFLVLAGVGLLIFLGARTMSESYPVAARHQGGRIRAGRAFVMLMRDRAFAAYTLSLGLSGAALFTYISSSPFVIEGIYARSAQVFSVVFAVNSVGIMSAGQIGARLVRRVGSATLLRAGVVQQSLAAIVLLVIALAGRPALLVLLIPLIFVVSAVGLVGPNATALALAPYGAMAGAASAQLGAFQFLTGAVAAPIAGAWGTGSVLPMCSIIAVAAVGALLACIAATRIDRDGDSTSGHIAEPIVVAGAGEDSPVTI